MVFESGNRVDGETKNDLLKCFTKVSSQEENREWGIRDRMKVARHKEFIENIGKRKNKEGKRK